MGSLRASPRPPRARGIIATPPIASFNSGQDDVAIDSRGPTIPIARVSYHPIRELFRMPPTKISTPTPKDADVAPAKAPRPKAKAANQKLQRAKRASALL